MAGRPDEAVMRHTPAQKLSARWFVTLGGLWLVLAAALLVYPLVRPTVEVRWETATEVETAGFNLYRGTSQDDISSRINQQGIIPGRGNALAGSVYTFSDVGVRAGETYYYLIEEVEYDGRLNRYEEDVFMYTVPYVTPLTAVLATISFIVGLALIVTGIREERSL